MNILAGLTDNIAGVIAWASIIIMLIVVMTSSWVLFYHWRKYARRSHLVKSFSIIYVVGVFIFTSVSLYLTVAIIN